MKKGPVIASPVVPRSSAMIGVTIPSIRSQLLFFDGFQLSAASV